MNRAEQKQRTHRRIVDVAVRQLGEQGLSGAAVQRIMKEAGLTHGGFYSHFFGEKVPREQIADIAWQCMQEEWEFNRRAGFGPEDDEMPATMKEDGIGPEKTVWDIPHDVVNKAYERFEPREELFTQKPS